MHLVRFFGGLFAQRRLAGGTAFVAALLATALAAAQQASVSAWDAANFRAWSYVPYWATQAQVDAFTAEGRFDHISDVIYFSGVRPTATGGLNYHVRAAGHLASLKSQAASAGVGFHLSMFDVPTGETVENVWNSITSNATYRAAFVNNVKNLVQANNMVGFNLDWERPDTAAEWANYTQLARDLKTALGPLGVEISVCDYGSTSSLWDNTAVFDANVYDQLFIMAYHANATQYASYANGKIALTGQGEAKAFGNDQLVAGIGTYGTGGPATVSYQAIVAANPNLPADATSFTGTVPDINGVMRTGTWTIQSRYQVREIVQLALDRGMPGVMNWTFHYDATNQLSLHRVAQHYIVVKRNVPDLNLDGRVDAADAHALADHMGSVPGWTGTNTAARFEDFYISGNWEQGDYNGNGFVNQQDADWLASRFTALGVNLPDRLPYSGTFENFAGAEGLAGRWSVIRNGGQLPETGNFTQHGAGYLPFDGSGAGADKHSTTAVTLRNQNAAEAYDSLNTANRVMQVELAAPIDTAAESATYFTMLVRQNTAPLLAAQLASTERTLALEFRDAAGTNQFDFALFGSQSQFGIRSQADVTGDDIAAEGFAAGITYLLVGKLSGHGEGANTLQAALLDAATPIGNFTSAAFPWMLTATGSSGFNPTISSLAVVSPAVANFTVSNVWIGGAASFFDSPAAHGDFNADGTVDAADYTVWRDGFGTHYFQSDYEVWKANFGQVLGGAGAVAAVPEPGTGLLAAALSAVFGGFFLTRTRRC